MHPSLGLAWLPLVSWICLIRLFHGSAWFRPWGGFRAAVLAAGVTLTLWTVALSEILSLARALRFETVAGAWVACAGGLLWRAIRRQAALGPIERGRLLARWRNLHLWVRLGGMGLILMAGTLLLLAIVAAPNTWDSMTYHLPRVCHWIQNRSLRHYPTHNLRQLYLNPLAEICLTHVCLLTGSDRLVNLVQFAATMGYWMGSSLIAAELGAGAVGQMLAAVLSATLPMGVLQATSTQNDAVNAFFLTVTAFAVLRSRSEPSLSAGAAVGVCAGLSILCKATSYLFAAPFLAGRVLLGAGGPSAGPLSRRLRGWIVMGAALVMINAGYWIRNAQLFGSPLGPREPEADVNYINETWTVPAWLSNVSRNLALHAQTRFPALAAFEFRCISFFHRQLGISVNDPRTTFAGTSFHPGLLRRTTNGDLAGNPQHLLLAGLAVALLAVRRPRGGSGLLAAYGGCVLAAGALFCFVLKWQPWHSRLHLPLFVLASPWTATVMSQRLRAQWTVLVSVLVFVLAIPCVVRNQTRPLVGSGNVFKRPRWEQYFAERPELLKPYASAALRVVEARPGVLGLEMSGDDWEYPIWLLLRECGVDCLIRHGKVTNASARAGRPDDPPWDAVLVVRNQGREIEVVTQDRAPVKTRAQSTPANLQP